MVFSAKDLFWTGSTGSLGFLLSFSVSGHRPVGAYAPVGRKGKRESVFDGKRFIRRRLWNHGVFATGGVMGDVGNFVNLLFHRLLFRGPRLIL